MLKGYLILFILIFICSCKCNKFNDRNELIVHYSKSKDTVYIYDNDAGKKYQKECLRSKSNKFTVLFSCTDKKGKTRPPLYQKKFWKTHISSQ